MNASTLFAAIAAVAFAGSAFAADTAGANAGVTATAAAQVGVAAQSVPAVASKPAGASRAQIRAEAVEANKNRRSTEASQFDWFNQ